MSMERYRKTILSGLGVALFAALISFVLCWLNMSIQQEKADFEVAYAQVPVEVTVTNLTGTRTDKLSIPAWVGHLFQEGASSTWFKDLRIKARHTVNDTCDFENFELIGISNIDMAPELNAHKGVTISYNSGFDESMFATEELLVLIPEEMSHCVDGDGTITLAFRCAHRDYPLSDPVFVETELTFIVAGTYSSVGRMALYCPYWAVDRVYYSTYCNWEIDSISATLLDNSKLEEFREFAAEWFAEPNISGEKTPWDFSSYTYYPYALDINDMMLRRVSAALGASVAINQFAATMVFIFSAGAGFIVGFLMIRSRKREILLMRTLGKADLDIYRDFAIEQMIFILAGALIGGAFFAWQPMGRLALFVGIYFTGLSAALTVFLRSRLLTGTKEEA